MVRVILTSCVQDTSQQEENESDHGRESCKAE